MKFFSVILGLSTLAGGLGLSGTVASPAGSADNVSQPRAVSGFDRVRIQGAFNTSIIAGAHETRVLLTANSDMLDMITTTVQSHTLVVSLREGLVLADRVPTIAISLPVLRALTQDGAVTTTVMGLNGGDFDLDTSGSGRLTASGRASRETVTLNGASKIDTTGIDARDVIVANNSVGLAEVRASDSLIANVNGVGEIRFTGSVKRVESHVNGGGSIRRI